MENAAAAALVRQRDRERYWSALFAPASKRAGLLALYAYNAELTHIADVINEPMVGQIRLQWWRDAIDLAAPGTKTGNPVADALAAAIVEHNLPKERLIEMADGRIPEIFGDPPADIQALRASLQATHGALFELAAAILGDSGELAGKAAGHAGLAYGLTQVLRTVPIQAARRKILLPPSYFESRGVNLAVLYRGKADASFGAALADLRGAANRALQQFHGLAPELDPAAWPAFLPLTLVKPYLKAMAAPSFDPLHTIASVNPIRRFWRIWRAARRRAI
ncbi:MAG: squalene/phytoene synthase family protein [Rhodomicrobium sp.]|nr:squalene/phytoene synthase family protein [Rhodomicrobium sp.]